MNALLLTARLNNQSIICIHDKRDTSPETHARGLWWGHDRSLRRPAPMCPCMRDGPRGRTMMQARQRRVDLQRISTVQSRRRERTCMRKRMAWYGYVTHNAPSSDAPDMTVCVVYGYYDRLGRAAETHQLLVVSRPWTSKLCDVPPLTLKCPAFQLLISCEIRPRYSLNDETEKRATLTPELVLSWREWETQ